MLVGNLSSFGPLVDAPLSRKILSKEGKSLKHRDVARPLAANQALSSALLIGGNSDADRQDELIDPLEEGKGARVFISKG